MDGAVDLRIIGWDRERLYFHRDGNDWSVSITPDGRTTDPVQVATPDGAFGSMLQDVSAGAELRRGGATLDIFQPFVGAPNEVPGTSGQLSPDGNFVLTHSGDGRPSPYDARSGAPEASWFDDSWTPLAATFTAEGRIVWVVDSHDGSLGLYECQSSRNYIDSFDPARTSRAPRGSTSAPMPVLAGVQPGLVGTTVVESVSATSG